MTDAEMRMASALARVAGALSGIIKVFEKEPAYRTFCASLQSQYDECVEAVRMIAPDFDKEKNRERKDNH